MAEDDQQEMRKRYGEPLKHDTKFRGPLWRSRSCTDVPCFFIFVAFLGGWGFIAHYAIKNGDLSKLMMPSDSYNQVCGLDSGVLNKKYLFFFNLEKCIDPIVPLTGCPTPQVCVERCPSERFSWDRMKDVESFENLKRLLICRTDFDKASIHNKNDIERAINNERCARWYMKTEPLLNRCMWELSPTVCEFIPELLLKGNRYYEANKTLPLAISQHRVVRTLTVKEDVLQCRSRAKESSTVIKEKMMHTNTRVAKLVSNMIAHFYNGTKNPQQLGEEIVEDIFNSWHVVLVATLCTLIISLIFISLMRWLAAPILWISIFGVLIGLIITIYFSVQQYIFWHNTYTVPNHSLNINAVFNNILEKESTWLYLTIVLCVVFVTILLLVIVLRSRIKIAIALTKEGSKAVSSVISTVFFPIFSWLLYVCVIIFTVSVGLYLGSIGEPIFRMMRWLDPNSITGVTDENCKCIGPASNYAIGQRCDPKIFQDNCYIPTTRMPCEKTTCSFEMIDSTSLINSFVVYNVFGFLWLIFFVAAFSDMVLALTFATWYWTFKKSDVPYFTLGRAFRQTIFYHLGTLAFGACILAVCRLIRIMLEYIHRKVKQYDNAVTRAIFCFMRCFFWLLEKFIRFLNRNAYIMCAIHGKNFCISAKDAFNLIMRNFLRVFTLDQVTDFLFFLSKVFITALAGVTTYYFLHYNRYVAARLHYIAVPTALVSIIAFIITSVFFGVYSMAVDTLFLCFLEDCERNDGTSEKPYFMSKNLMKILGRRNERISRNNNTRN